MVDWSFVDLLSAEFEGCKIVEGDSRSKAPKREWCLNGTAVAWERPLSKRDMAALGASAPKGPVMAVRVPDLQARDQWISKAPQACFTSLHFATYPAVLVDMERADAATVRALFDLGVQAVTLKGL